MLAPSRESHQVAGFVLVGGQSRRMGRDKALLPHAGEVLAQKVASVVRQATPAVALLGNPQLYSHLGYPVVADIIPGCGPLSGLHAALGSTGAEWILLVACDLPNLTPGLLQQLLAHTAPDTRCVAAQTARGLEPLCAVYHRNIRPEVEAALREGRLRMRDLVAHLGGIGVEADPREVLNVNTEESWRLHLSEEEPLT